MDMLPYMSIQLHFINKYCMFKLFTYIYLTAIVPDSRILHEKHMFSQLNMILLNFKMPNSI